MGVLTDLFVAPEHGPPVPVAAVEAVARHGLRGDHHAKAVGPRQVLVVRQEALDELGVGAADLRANLAVAGLVEADLGSGAELRLGAGARVRITHACEVCRVLRAHVDREAFRRLPGRRGALGVVVAGGPIAVGDPVSARRAAYPVVPDAVGERVAWVVARIPAGRVARYDTLLTLVGATRAHYRVLPLHLRRAMALGLPAHRVLTSAGTTTGHVPEQAALLAQEGVRLDAGGRLLDDGRRWDGREVYRTRRGG